MSNKPADRRWRGGLACNFADGYHHLMRVKLRLIFMLAAAFEIFTCKSAPAQSVQGVDSPEADGEMVEAMTETDAFEEEIDEDYTTEDYTAIEAENDEIHEELKVTANLDDIPESSFSEVWAYLITGSEGDLKSRYPISDIVYFTSEVDRYGHLVDVPRRKNIGRFAGRVHLALVCNSAGLTHFVIQDGSEARKQLISEILSAVKDYDGLNVDMESVPARDADTFLSFLVEIRAGLGGKMLSVCVPGRRRAGGTYNYAEIAALADRVFVMAYDEHWSGSSPGPVASMAWGRAVASYALHTIGQEKLVMGIPFYGRSWGDKSTSRALIYSTTERLKTEYNAKESRREDGIPTFTYEVNVKVTVYYEDEYSIATRMNMYRRQGVQRIGFWRLGQEAPDIWKKVRLED